MKRRDAVDHPLQNESGGHFIDELAAARALGASTPYILLRELLPVSGLPDHDHVLIGREGGVERDFARLREELAAALARAAEGKGDPPRRRR